MDVATGPAPAPITPEHSEALPAARRPARGFRSAWSERLVAAAVLAPTLALLLVAAYLSPDAAGHGTHQQLGLPACGFQLATGLPCATCGMTTAFSHAADGDLVSAFVVQPVGALLALATAVTVLISGYAAATGVSLAPLARSVARPRTFIALGVLVLLGWAYTLTLTLLG